MPIQRLKDYLDRNGIKYVIIGHSRAYTAQEIAASAHIPGLELAKTVIVKLDGVLAMAVLPASERVDLDLLKMATGSATAELAKEEEFRDLFPGCEPGAMPPFGNLYGLKVYVAPDLTKDELIAFNAGSHTELLQLSYKDFEFLVQPMKLEFAVLA